MNQHNVLLPLMAPTTEDLLKAVATIVRDVQRECDQTDAEMAAKLDVHKNTIAGARNKQSALGALTIARIGATYGVEFIAPYHALYGAAAHGVAASDAAPLSELADAMAALMRANGPKARLDTLPVIKKAAEALDAYVVAMERWRTAA